MSISISKRNSAHAGPIKLLKSGRLDPGDQAIGGRNGGGRLSPGHIERSKVTLPPRRTCSEVRSSSPDKAGVAGGHCRQCAPEEQLISDGASGVSQQSCCSGSACSCMALACMAPQSASAMTGMAGASSKKTRMWAKTFTHIS